MIFMLAMVLYPEVQARAQAEIDSVIGEGLQRLPHWEDRSSLHYVEAVLKETLRWHPAVPLGKQAFYPLIASGILIVPRHSACHCGR